MSAVVVTKTTRIWWLLLVSTVTLSLSGVLAAQTSCTSDSDCDMAHHDCGSVKTKDCPDDGCRPEESDQECADRTRANCTTVEIQVCLAHWDKLCSETSDCRDGFECMSDSCRPGFECADDKFCRPTDASCTKDADCPDLWKCDADQGRCVIPPIEVTPDERAEVDSQESSASPSEVEGNDDDSANGNSAGGCAVFMRPVTPSVTQLLAGIALLLFGFRRRNVAGIR